MTNSDLLMTPAAETVKALLETAKIPPAKVSDAGLITRDGYVLGAYPYPYSHSPGEQVVVTFDGKASGAKLLNRVKEIEQALQPMRRLKNVSVVRSQLAPLTVSVTVHS